MKCIDEALFDLKANIRPYITGTLSVRNTYNEKDIERSVISAFFPLHWAPFMEVNLMFDFIRQFEEIRLTIKV